MTPSLLARISMILLLSLISISNCLAQPYTAGLKLRNVAYLDTQLGAAIWYPSKATESNIEFGPFAMRVARDGAPIEGAHPLIVISHGTGGNQLGHADLAEALARTGFVVAAITHAGDNYRDRSLVSNPRYLTERPAQISALIDMLLASREFAHLIAPTMIGAIGHSAGGYTVAALIGGRPDSQRLGQHCRDHARDDAAMCAFSDPKAGVDPSQAGDPFRLPANAPDRKDVADPRIRAAALLAPFAVPIAPGSLARADLPVLLIGTARDEVLNPKYHVLYLKSELRRAHLVIEDGAGHYSFITAIPESKRAMFGPAAQDPQGFDRVAFHDRLAAQLSAFFDDALKGSSK